MVLWVIVCFHEGRFAVTVEMTTRFRHPVVTNQQAIVSAHVTRFYHPLCLLEANIVQDGKVKATAKGKFYDQGSKSVVNGVQYVVCQVNDRN